MIASLSGTLVHKSPTEIVIDVKGVGYHVNIPLSTFEQLGAEQSDVKLLTYMHVREDALQLFGFATEEERNLFKLLISVSGIGPKMAQGILSGVAVTDLRDHIIRGNLGALTSIPGIGRKIAERLVVELRDKIGKLEVPIVTTVPASDAQTKTRSEALLALTSLGYNRASAEKALRIAIQETDGRDVSVEVLIKGALRHAAK